MEKGAGGGNEFGWVALGHRVGCGEAGRTEKKGSRFFQTPCSMSGRTLIRSYDSAGKSYSAIKSLGGQ